MQIITRIFIDDFEKLLKERYNDKIVLDTGSDEAQINSYIRKYLLSRLKININGKESVIKFIGKEYDDDIVRFYLEITDIATLKTIAIYNSCLIRDFEDQQNIIKINVNKKHKTLYLNKKTYKNLLNF